jgi:hypothetical protein
MREERGWLMVEIMIGAVALIISGLAIYQGLDGASSASGRNRNRSTAAFIAQQDQERLRALDASALNQYVKSPVTQTVTVQGINYQVTSQVSYASTNGTASCTSASSLTTYLKISSTVVDPSNKNGPVRLDSLLAPRASQGGATVQLVDRSGTTGVQGVPVALDQDASKNDTTDTNGCAQFGYLNGSSYTVTFSKAGYVDWNGVNVQANKAITVVPGRSTLTQFNYDLAGSITGVFADGNGAAFNPANACCATAITVSNNAMSPVTKHSATSSVAVGSLFPFVSNPYKVWAGPCDQNDPTTWQAPPTVTLAPGQAATPTVREPKLAIQVNKSTGGGLSNARVLIKDTGCNPVYAYPAQPTNASGALTMYLPYGTYSICADNSLAPTLGNNKTSSTFVSQTPAGTTLPALTVNGAGGPCT